MGVIGMAKIGKMVKLDELKKDDAIIVRLGRNVEVLIVNNIETSQEAGKGPARVNFDRGHSINKDSSSEVLLVNKSELADVCTSLFKMREDMKSFVDCSNMFEKRITLGLLG